LVSTLRALGAEPTPVSRVEIVAGQTGTLLSLDLPLHRLALAGTTFDACAGLCPPRGTGAPAVVLSDAGRYGRAWWLSLTVGGRAVTVLGSHIRLIPHPYGHAVGMTGQSPSAARSTPAGPRAEPVCGPTVFDGVSG
jgi:hypothetical protein